MRPVLALARLYLLGSLRRQIHLATLFLGGILFILPAYVNTFSLGVGAFETVATDFGLTLIGYFIVGMALMLGSTTVPVDFEARSVYPVLARPISRTSFLVAHLLAVAIMLGGSLLLLGLCLMASIALMIRTLDAAIFMALYGCLLQAAVVAAISLMLSVRLRPAAAAAAGALLFLVGSFSSDLFQLVLGGPPLLASLMKAAGPDFSAFTLKGAVVHHLAVSPSYLLSMTLYGLGWIVVALTIASQAFEDVDL